MDTKTDQHSKSPPSLIEIEALSKSYKQGGKFIFALQDLHLIVEKDDIYGIIGLSGAGKSTLIRCLARLIIPSSGAILFQGKSMEHLGKKSLRDFRKKVGMIFQHFNLLSSRTVAANISYPLEIAKIPKEERSQRIDKLLRLVGLETKKTAYPSQLSGGEKQRVGIARALANQPELLLCDEATSALDPKTTKEILTLLKTINKELGITVVLITHQMEVIKQICNKVAVIEKGKIVESGLVAQVFTHPQHQITKHFLESASHEIPPEFFKKLSPNQKLLRLKFKGTVASQPIISQIIKKFNVEANILLGWIDRLQSVSIGTLIIELCGSSTGIQQALVYFQENHVQYEVIEHEPE